MHNTIFIIFLPKGKLVLNQYILINIGDGRGNVCSYLCVCVSVCVYVCVCVCVCVWVRDRQTETETETETERLFSILTYLDISHWFMLKENMIRTFFSFSLFATCYFFQLSKERFTKLKSCWHYTLKEPEIRILMKSYNATGLQEESQHQTLRESL